MCVSFMTEKVDVSMTPCLHHRASTAKGGLDMIQKALQYLTNNSHYGHVIPDSREALSFLNCLEVLASVKRIQILLSTSKDRGLAIQSLWIPSHTGFNRLDSIDKMIKQVGLKLTTGFNLSMTSNDIKSILIRDLAERKDKRPNSISMKYYNWDFTTEHSYGKHTTRIGH